MNTYLRILSFAKPLRLMVPAYVLFTLFSTIFGLMNLTLLIPILDVLFDRVGDIQSQLPEFSLTKDYFVNTFNYYFLEFIQEKGKLGGVMFICGIIVVSVLLSNCFRYIASVITIHLRTKLVKNIREKVFRNTTRLDLSYFSNQKKGDIIARITSDVNEIESSILNSFKTVFKEPFQVIITIAILIIISPKLTLVALIIVPASGLIISTIAKKLKKAALESQTSIGKLASIIDETLGGIRVVKAFNARDYTLKKFNDENESYAKTHLSMSKKFELASPLSEILGVLVVTGILLYGSTMILANDPSLQASEFITYLLISSIQLPTPLKAISNSITGIQRGLAAGDRIFQLIDASPKIRNEENAIKANTFSKRIEFKDVSFKYDQKEILKNINLIIEKGKTVALVGASGGGKSTLVDLIPRFYDPISGEILLDNTPLKSYDIESIRELMGIVTQESILFNDTIYNNIRFGSPQATEDDIISAAKIANAHDFIVETENGYQTHIGDRGTKLSGGQKQRISIARAVLKNPPILILDEATSALDSESERLVQDALIKLMKNRTSIVIAHRLSTIQHADEIVVLQEGKIIERGTHQLLMEKNGIYKKLNEMQSL